MFTRANLCAAWIDGLAVNSIRMKVLINTAVVWMELHDKKAGHIEEGSLIGYREKKLRM